MVNSQLLRPELVAGFPRPLCADGFSAFIHADPDRSEMNNDIRRATWWLRHKVIPNVAKKYCKTSQQEMDIVPLGVYLHAHGVNLRYLGLFASHININKKSHIDEVYIGNSVLIPETAARVLKLLVRRKMREQLSTSRLPQEGTLRRVLVDFFNECDLQLTSGFSKLRCKRVLGTK